MAVDADVYAAEARTAAARVDVIRAQTGKDQALARLRSLLGIDHAPQIELAETGTPTGSRATFEPGILVTSPRVAPRARRRRRPHRKPWSPGQSHQSRPAARGRPLGPWKTAQPNERFLPPVDERNDSWAIGVVGQLEVLRRQPHQRAGRLGARRAARARRRTARELERQIRLDVEPARLELRAALEAVTASDAPGAAATSWEQASSERYTAGLALISELLDAQADLSAAEMAQMRTRATAWIARPRSPAGGGPMSRPATAAARDAW